MNTQTSKKAILKHQFGHTAANLMWGPPLPNELAILAKQGCEKLHDLGYFASPFPEGDGITLSHPEYIEQTALQDVRSAFPWLRIDDKT